MSSYGGFVRGGEHTDDVAQQQSTNGPGVIILAPKQAPQPVVAADSRPSTILNIRKALQKSTGRRAESPDSPPAGRRRASPTYEPIKPRVSPSYQPHSKPAETTAWVGHAAGPQDSPAADRSGSRSRSSSSRCCSSLRSRSRNGSTSRRQRRQQSSRSRSRHRHRHRSSSPERRHRSSSRSRRRDRAAHGSSHDSRRSKRHKRSRSRSRSRIRGTNCAARSRSRDRKKSHRHEHSRHFSRSDRQRSASPVPFSRHEKGRAWADQRAFNTVNPVRRGKQGLGFLGGARLLPQQPEPDGEGDLSWQRNSDRVATAGAGTASGRSSKWVSALDAAALIPGYDHMAPAEKLKARMQLVMSKAEQQSAAAEAAAAGAVGPSGVGKAADTTSSEGWTRFVLDQHGELEEDKHARQHLLDSEVGQSAMGGFGNAADDTVDTDAAFIMGTGRVAAQRAGIAQAAEAAHDDAIFGRPYGTSSVDGSEPHHGQQHLQGLVDRSNDAARLPLHNGSAALEHGSVIDRDDEDDAKQLAASLGVSESLVVSQQKHGLSWRDKVLAMRAKRQQ